MLKNLIIFDTKSYFRDIYNITIIVSIGYKRKILCGRYPSMR